MNEMMMIDFVLMGPSPVGKQNRIQIIAAGETGIPCNNCHHSFDGNAKKTTL